MPCSRATEAKGPWVEGSAGSSSSWSCPKRFSTMGDYTIDQGGDR